MTALSPPPFTLNAPGTIRFTAVRAFRGRHLTACCLSLREQRNRVEFLADPAGYVARFDLDSSEQQLVVDLDWTGLLRRGAHLQAVLKLAATVGDTLFDIGGHNVGVSGEELAQACPRLVSGLPGEA